MRDVLNKNVYAILIGVGDYERMQLPNLHTYRMDVAMFGTALEVGLGVPSDHLRLMAGEGNSGIVSRMHLARAIADFQEFLKEEDIFVFYFSGHGREGHLVFSDGQIELQSVIDYVEKLPPRSKWVILDCCYSGDFQSTGARCLHLGEHIADFAERGIAVFASSSADGESRLGPDGTHSLFTGALSSTILLRKNVRNGSLTLNDIAEGTRELVLAWNRENPEKEQTPVFRSSIGGTIFFQVEDASPYVSQTIHFEREGYRMVSIKPLHTAVLKRYAAFVMTSELYEPAILASFTKEIAEEVKTAAVYTAPQEEYRLKKTSAEVVWCYFCRDENDHASAHYYARGIYAWEPEARKKYYREDSHSFIIKDTCILENPSYSMMKEAFRTEVTEEEFTAQTGRLLTLIVTLAEQFIYDLREAENGTETFTGLQERYSGWITEVRKGYLGLSEIPIPPLGLEEWTLAVMDLAGWILDISIHLEKRGEKLSKADDTWLIKNAIRHYHESVNRIKELEDGISHTH